MSRPRIPDEVLDAAHARARARAAHDWQEADRLKAEIEAAGWRVVDHGTDFALAPASPPDVVEDARIRYGSSGGVPSRLAEAPVGPATVVLVATDEPEALTRTLTALETTSPAGTSVVVVGDGPSAAQDAALDVLDAAGGRAARLTIEVVRTSARLGAAAALNIGIRRSLGPVIVVIDPTVEATGDLVTPLIRALDDPTVAIGGGWGSVTRDRRHFEEAPPGDVDVVDGSLMAFRRIDAAARGPIDERFRTARYVAIWWSLTLRDGGAREPHRRALRLAGLPAVRHEPAAPRDGPVPDQERGLKRDHYRFLEGLGSRADLFAPARDDRRPEPSDVAGDGP